MKNLKDFDAALGRFPKGLQLKFTKHEFLNI